MLNTHRMLAANQQMMRQAWPFLAAERPVIVDWLPWSHTFGGSHNMGMVLTNGGTLYIDAGRPAPGLFAQTITNLSDIAPTIYFNVPAGYAQLIPALEADPEFARKFLHGCGCCSTPRPRCHPGCVTGSVMSPPRPAAAPFPSPAPGVRPRPRQQ